MNANDVTQNVRGVGGIDRAAAIGVGGKQCVTRQNIGAVLIAVQNVHHHKLRVGRRDGVIAVDVAAIERKSGYRAQKRQYQQKHQKEADSFFHTFTPYQTTKIISDVVMDCKGRTATFPISSI